MNCPNCNRTLTDRMLAWYRGQAGVNRCAACRYVWGECWLGNSYTLFAHQTPAPRPVQARYVGRFEIQTVGSAGLGLRKGTYDTRTGQKLSEEPFTLLEAVA